MVERSTRLPLLLASTVAGHYSRLSQVEAVVLAGSQASGTADQGSDVDLYVYLRAEIPVDVRARIATARGEQAEVDNRFWEPGDEWLDTETGIHVDVMFRSVAWVEAQLDRVLRQHEASMGYSTCLWHNIVTSQPLYDRKDWFQRLQREAKQPYPEELRRAIVTKNHPILRQTASSYEYQLERAVARSDWVSVNHRVAAILASYYDILFAVNRMLHPGEKRLVQIAGEQCTKAPAGMGQQVNELIRSVSHGRGVVEKAKVLVDGLDDLLSAEGLGLFEAAE